MALNCRACRILVQGAPQLQTPQLILDVGTRISLPFVKIVLVTLYFKCYRQKSATIIVIFREIEENPSLQNIVLTGQRLARAAAAALTNIVPIILCFDS